LTGAALVLLAMWFVEPLKLPTGARLWMFLPLALCVATVYRATRARSPRELPVATVLTLVQITVIMALIAVGFLLLHLAIIHLF